MTLNVADFMITIFTKKQQIYAHNACQQTLLNTNFDSNICKLTFKVSLKENDFNLMSFKSLFRLKSFEKLL